MIFDNYFQVPDGAMCRPILLRMLVTECAYNFYPKNHWLNAYFPEIDSFRGALGKWETEERTITITERDFDKAWIKSCGAIDEPWKENMKKELFHG